MASRVNERTLALLSGYVETHSGIPAADVAAHLGVTVRSVRTYVRQFNSLMDGAAHIANNRGGYRITVSDEPAYRAWAERHQAEAGRIPDTPQERVSYLISDLLSRTDWITLDDLAEILFCSRRTVSNDLRQVESYLSSFGLELEKRPHYGIRVNGSELKRRVCLANNVLDRMSQELPAQEPSSNAVHDDGGPGDGKNVSGGGPCDKGKHGSALRHDFHLDLIASCVDEALSEADFHVNAVAYQNLLVHIAIAIERIRAGSFVPLDRDREERIRHTEGWPVAQRIAQGIERSLAVKLPDGEIAYIAIHLAGKQVLLPEGSDAGLPAAFAGELGPTAVPAGSAVAARETDSQPGPGSLVIADDVWNLVTDMIETVRQVFHFDLRDDLELRMNLARHIVPLSVRLTYHMRLENPLRAEIRAHYPLAFSFAREASHVLADAYGQPVSDDEVSYLALSFALAIETRKAAQQRPKNILIVCASGLGSARLLEIRCREEFGEHLGSIQTADVSQLDAIDFAAIDYVFSTVHIDRPLPVPVREVGFFLDAQDAAALRPLLHEGGRTAPPAPYFSPDLFFAHMPARTREQVLRFLVERIAAQEDVPPDFLDQIRARERSASTAFGNDVAMPHPLVPVGSRTFVAVGLADGPIAWGDKSVRAVFLISVSTDESEDLHALYDGLLRLTSDAGAVGELLADQRYETLRRLLPGDL